MMTPKPWRQRANEIVGGEGTPDARVICILAYGHVSPAPPFDYLIPAHAPERNTVEANARAILQVPAMVHFLRRIADGREYIRDYEAPKALDELQVDARAILAELERK